MFNILMQNTSKGDQGTRDRGTRGPGDQGTGDPATSQTYQGPPDRARLRKKTRDPENPPAEPHRKPNPEGDTLTENLHAVLQRSLHNSRQHSLPESPLLFRAPARTALQKAHMRTAQLHIKPNPGQTHAVLLSLLPGPHSKLRPPSVVPKPRLGCLEDVRTKP